jgi:hypothetical protein
MYVYSHLRTSIKNYQLTLSGISTLPLLEQLPGPSVPLSLISLKDTSIIIIIQILTLSIAAIYSNSVHPYRMCIRSGKTPEHYPEVTHIALWGIFMGHIRTTLGKHLLNSQLTHLVTLVQSISDLLLMLNPG